MIPNYETGRTVQDEVYFWRCNVSVRAPHPDLPLEVAEVE